MKFSFFGFFFQSCSFPLLSKYLKPIEVSKARVLKPEKVRAKLEISTIIKSNDNLKIKTSKIGGIGEQKARNKIEIKTTKNSEKVTSKTGESSSETDFSKIFVTVFGVVSFTPQYWSITSRLLFCL